NAVRSIAEAQRIVAVLAYPAIVVRGDAATMKLADWLIREFDGAASGAPVSGFRQTTFDDSLVPPQRRTPEVRIYYPSRLQSPQELMEAVNAVRSIGDLQRVVVVIPPAARPSIVLRWTADQAVQSEWILRQSDQEAPAASPQDFPGTVSSLGVVR